MKEKAVLFGKFNTLVGVVTLPDDDPPHTAPRPAVILSNAGLIHRIGPNRIYVKLARVLAQHGFPVLRFDLSGAGDSKARPDHMPVEQYTIDDVLQAMDYLAEFSGSQKFVLGGHCAGAYHSFRTADQDARVIGVIMINPDGGEAEWVEYDRKRKLARYYENYYGKKVLLDRQRWKRFLTFRVDYRHLVKTLFQNVIWGRVSALIFRLRRKLRKPQPTPVDKSLFTMESIVRRLATLDTQVFLAYSENATSLERIQSSMPHELKHLQADGKLQLNVIPGADHIFSPLASQDCLFQAVEQWMDAHF